LVYRNPRLRYPTGQWIRETQRLIELDARLPGILQGEAQPSDAGEGVELARLCQMHKKRYAAAAHFYAEAFTAQPKLAEKLGSPGGRYDAACAAALAGCGKGERGHRLPEQQRSRLRRQALDWLRADLEAWRRLLEKEPDKVRPVVIQHMQHWLTDS